MAKAKLSTRPTDPIVKTRERGAFADDAAQRTKRKSLMGSVGQSGPPSGDADAYSISEFCARHSFSPQLYYKMKAEGLTPREFRVGNRVLISKEAATAWRAKREAETEAALADALVLLPTDAA